MKVTQRLPLEEYGNLNFSTLAVSSRPAVGILKHRSSFWLVRHVMQFPRRNGLTAFVCSGNIAE